MTVVSYQSWNTTQKMEKYKLGDLIHTVTRLTICVIEIMLNKINYNGVEFKFLLSASYVYIRIRINDTEKIGPHCTWKSQRLALKAGRF